MRKWIAAVSLAIMACTAHASVPFEELLYKGQAIPGYGTASSELQQMILDTIKRGHLAERMARLTNGTIRLRTNLAIVFKSCGSPNAYYSPRDQGLFICLEMLELMARLARADTEGVMAAGREEFAQTIDGAVWGIFFHELGHAIISINRVPITGREEDVADQFALYFATQFVEPQGVPVVKPTVWLFTQMAKRTDLPSADQATLKRLLSDEHSLDQQRIYNLACWAFGANPTRGVASVRFVELPQERGVRCISEYGTLERGVRKQFQKYLKVRPR